MAPLRPANLNKRRISSTGGNGGVIGPTTTPYLNGQLSLGSRCCGGCNTGRFTLSESYCGVKEFCRCSVTDCKGFFICCGPGTEKWFVAPQCTGVIRNWYSRNDAVTVANSCMGSCGWFIPTRTQLGNPAFVCKTYWDWAYVIPTPAASTFYWSSTEYSGIPNAQNYGCSVSMRNNNAYGFIISVKTCTTYVRAFRCTAS